MCDTLKTLLLLDGWMDLNQTWTQCSPSGGHLGCAQLLDPDPDPDPNTEHTPNAPPLGEHCFHVWFKSIQPSRRSSVLRVSHFITLFGSQDPKTEHNPDAPSLGEHCAQVWFISIQPSRRRSVLSVSHIFCHQIRILIQKLSTPQMPPH